MSEILHDKLYLGSLSDVENINWLLENNITDVMTIASNIDFVSLTNLLEKNNIKHHIFEVYDNSNENISELFPTLFKIIDSANIICVHCSFGISRSPTVIIAYLMYKHKMFLDDATKFVLKSRICIFPNDNFMMQLFKFEKELFGLMSFTHDKYGIAKYKNMIHTYQ